jgi:hypothetical protein
MRGIFGPKRDKVTGKWRRLHNEELNDLYYSQNIIWVTKSRRKMLARHVACMGRGEVHIGCWWENLSERGHLEDPGVDGRIILKYIEKKWFGGAWTGFIWFSTGTDGRLV